MTAETQTRVNRPLVVELVGSPGAGKTTLVAGIKASLARSGLVVATPNENVRDFTRRKGLGRMVPGGLARPLLWLLYRWGSQAAALKYLAVHPRLAWLVISTATRRPSDSLARARRPLHWFLRLLGTHQHLLKRGRAGEVIVLDEGFLHKAVQLFSSPVEKPASDSVATYVAGIPATDLVIHVSAPVATCANRVRLRGVWPRLGEIGDEQLSAFIANAHDTVELAVAAARTMGRTVVTLDNGGELPESAGYDAALHTLVSL